MQKESSMHALIARLFSRDHAAGTSLSLLLQED